MRKKHYEKVRKREKGRAKRAEQWVNGERAKMGRRENGRGLGRKKRAGYK